MRLTGEHSGHNDMTMNNARKTIAAGQFKARCLGLIDQVSRNKEILIITKHGRPVAKVVPIADSEPASLRGSVRYHVDLLESAGEILDAEK